MTYSIIAQDSDSGALGVAVQSHWFNVAERVPWVRFGAGAVATQARSEPMYGWRGLEAMESGSDASAALEMLLGEDATPERRQVGMLDAEGGIAVHTGSECIRYAAHTVGESWVVLGNMLSAFEVVDAMAEAFVGSSGVLADRLVTVLEAAEQAGGDVRGRQSAAIRVVPAGAGEETGVHLSVADHTDPVAQLRRLVEMDKSYKALDMARRALAAGNTQDARVQFAVATSGPRDLEVDFWSAIGLAELDRVDEAEAMMRQLVTERPSFRELLERVAERDAVADDLSTRLE